MLQLETVSGACSFHSYTDDSVKIIMPQVIEDKTNINNSEITEENNSLRVINTTVLVYDRKIITLNLASSFEQFDQGSLNTLLNCKKNIILVGTGNTSRFPEVNLLKYIYKNDLAIDFMDTGAACRTFNILSSEGREVAALIFLQ